MLSSLRKDPTVASYLSSGLTVIVSTHDAAVPVIEVMAAFSRSEVLRLADKAQARFPQATVHVLQPLRPGDLQVLGPVSSEARS